jgi:hypothetical protein
MVETFREFAAAINLNESRFVRPRKFVFFCGGQMPENGNSRNSLRQYLICERRIDKKIQGDTILAENATQLYRDSDYKDLISFEEDIAKISSVVLIIVESVGSFAELGAFASISEIRSSLAILIQEKFRTAESFLRFGPVKRLENDDQVRVGYYPWETHKNNGKIVVSKVKPHFSDIVSFINTNIKKAEKRSRLSARSDLLEFCLVISIIHFCRAIPFEKIRDYMQFFGHPVSKTRLTQVLYCLMLAEWIVKEGYSNREFYITTFEADPIQISYHDGAKIKDTIRWKSLFHTELSKDINIPKYIENKIIERKRLDR